MKYRPEIDGLRTIAVLPVILYHLKIPLGDGYLMQGGFLGVDVFFTISGFLITSIILEEYRRTGQFSVRRFYGRRARRILPALIMVLIASMVAAYWLLSPSELDRFGKSTLAALAFLSNFYWYFALGEYGAQASLLQPLLHTWSLAIEEQFYLFFPLMLLLIRPGSRPTRALSIICVLALGSLIAAEITTQFSKPLSFFSPVSRAWELLAGAIVAFGLAYFPSVARPGARLARVLPKLGLAVLLLSMWTIDLDRWDHPGLVTLPTVLATAAILWSARSGEAATGLLSTRPFVFIGKLSYSLYLWHFPIFAFGRLGLLGEAGWGAMLIWLGLTFAFSIAGYYLVERPFRFGLEGRTMAISAVTAVTAIVAVVTVEVRTSLISGTRTQDLGGLYRGQDYDNEILRSESWAVLDRLAGEGESIGVWNAQEPSMNERNNLWFDDDAALKVLVIGNSHSKDLFITLQMASESLHGFQVARFGLGTGFPDEHTDLLLSSPNYRAADVVLIASRYDPPDLDLLPGLIARFQAHGKLVGLVGNTAQFVSPSWRPIFDYFVRRSNGEGELFQMNAFAFRSQVGHIADLNEGLRQVAERSGALYLSRADLVCPPEERLCILITPEGRKTMYDDAHWSLEGSSYFAERIVDLGWLQPVFEAACRQRLYCPKA